MHSKFVEDSKNFFKFALSKEDKGWKTIENYIKKNRYQIRSFYNNLHWDSVATSVEFCEILLNTVKNHNCDNKTLITSLTDIITVFSINNSNFRDYIYEYGDYIECAINNLEANSGTSVFGEDEGILQLTALLGNYQLMDILIKYGLVKNFPRECPFLEARTMEIMRHLL